MLTRDGPCDIPRQDGVGEMGEGQCWAVQGDEARCAGAAQPGETSASPLDWLMAILQAAMEGVMAGDATPLQKANVVARLAGQYLKAYGAKDQTAEPPSPQSCRSRSRLYAR